MTGSPALAMVEVDSVARGLRALDALVKKAPVHVLEANLVEPGRFLILFAGGVGEVEESYTEAVSVADDELSDRLFLADAHPAILRGLRGSLDLRAADDMDCLAVIEGSRVASTLHAAERSLKEADVSLAGLRVSGGLGGRAYYVVFGAQHDVEAAIVAGKAVMDERGQLKKIEIIPRPHPEMVMWLLRGPPFAVGSEKTRREG